MGKHVSGRRCRVTGDHNLVRNVHQAEWARGHKQEIQPSCNASVTLGGKHILSLPVDCSEHTTAGASKFRILHTPAICPHCLNAKSGRSTRCYKKLNSAPKLMQRTTSQVPQRHMYFIGFDVHKKTISYCVQDAAGRVH